MEDRVVAVRKRAEVEPKHCLSILLNHGTEHHHPFAKSVSHASPVHTPKEETL